MSLESWIDAHLFPSTLPRSTTGAFTKPEGGLLFLHQVYVQANHSKISTALVKSWNTLRVLATRNVERRVGAEEADRLPGRRWSRERRAKEGKAKTEPSS